MVGWLEFMKYVVDMGLDVTIYIPNSAEISLAIKSGVRRDTAC
jgi:hypothetical protein